MLYIRKNKGITLIALVITIIVLLILAGVAITAIVGEEGLINRSQMSAFVTDMKAYEEQTNIYIYEQYNENGLETVSVGLLGQNGIRTVIPDIKNMYEDQVIVQQNKMYYKYNGTKVSKKRVEWCFKNNIPVWGYDNLDDFNSENADEPEDTAKGDIPNPTSEYKKIGNIYICIHQI